jgi:glutaredoxin
MMPTPLRLLSAALLAMAALPAAALYKVVQPDGSVTYTDRPPVDQNVRITPLNRGGAPGTAAAASQAVPVQTANLPPLPAELRQAVQRHPVTLYAAPECPPCAEGRALLQQRGIPYSERRIETADDVAAFERLSGGRTLPMLAIGEQLLRGFSNDWANFLDAAGYPRESRLPRNWPPATVSAMAPRAPAAAAPPPPAPVQPAAAPPVEEPPATADGRSPSRIRF